MNTFAYCCISYHLALPLFYCFIHTQWAGNYFMAGGQVKGGQVLGRYPQPMSEANDHWIGRGRFIRKL